jgi:predicted porin
MLNRLLPDQVSKFWPIIKYAVEQSLPPIVGEHPDKMNRILSSALCGKVDVWVSYDKEKNNKVEGIVLTEFLFDEPSGTKNMLIYCLYGYNQVSNDSWLEGIKGLAKFAKSRQCNQIVAYTSEDVIIKTVESLGGEANYTFISFDVNKII